MKQQLNRVRLTAGRVADFTCPLDKAQAFLWDTYTPSLALRASAGGRKTYIFESRLHGATIRINIGTLAATLEQARAKAQAFKVLVDSGTDPRELERDRQAAVVDKKAAAAAKVEADKVAALTVGEVWAAYIEERRPHWGALHCRDHIDKAKAGGLQRGQLAAWFTAVQQLQNPAIAACIQMMLLTGASPGEVLALHWEDMNTQWKGISIRDKVEGTREIPATPYMLHLLATLPRRNQWVFFSPTSATGCLTEPNNPHTRACKAAGLERLTLHGLRRSFKSLTEWLEVPVGVVAQIQGHKPSATAEKHYTVRPLELLRVHHECIEAWILEPAGIAFDAKAAPDALRVVAG